MMVKSFLKVACRGYSNWIPRHRVQIQRPSLISQESYAAFQDSLPNILHTTFVERVRSIEVQERIKRITEHIVTDGKNMRAMLVVHAYNMLEKPQNITEESLYHIRVLAWVVEMVHSYFIILDDIEDEAKTRRGKPCWHLLSEVGMQAVNDASLFRSFLYEVLKQNFLGKPTFMNIRDLIDKSFLYTSIGQHLDSKICKTRNSSIDNLTLDRYNTIVDYKTSYYTFKAPIYLAMTMVDRVDKDAYQYLNDICTNIGKLLQMKNDYQDCYVNEDGTDIQKGKCSWLAVTALQRCSPPQRVVLSACYGSRETAHIERVKRLYDQLHLPKLYKEQAKLISDRIARKAQELETNTAIPSEIFIKLLDTIGNR